MPPLIPAAKFRPVGPSTTVRPPVIYSQQWSPAPSTTAVAPEVLEAMLPYLSDYYGNPSSMYRFAGRAEAGLSLAREQVAELLGATPEEIIFTACGTESDNAAIHSALSSQPDKRHIITTKVEHPAVLATAQQLENSGYSVTWLGVDEKGRLDLEEARASFRPDTALIAVMYANNETGNVYPIAEIAAMAAERGVQRSPRVHGACRRTVKLRCPGKIILPADAVRAQAVPCRAG